MEEEQVREALNAHWRASAVGDANAEHDIYDDDAICDYPEVRGNRRPSWQKESKTGVLTYHADVRYQLVKNTAVKPARKPEGRTWRLRASAAIQLARSPHKKQQTFLRSREAAFLWHCKGEDSAGTYLRLGPARIHVWPTTSGTVISATGTNGLLRYRVRHGEYA